MGTEGGHAVVDKLQETLDAAAFINDPIGARLAGEGPSGSLKLLRMAAGVVGMNLGRLILLSLVLGISFGVGMLPVIVLHLVLPKSETLKAVEVPVGLFFAAVLLPLSTTARHRLKKPVRFRR